MRVFHLNKNLHNNKKVLNLKKQKIDIKKTDSTKSHYLQNQLHKNQNRVKVGYLGLVCYLRVQVMIKVGCLGMGFLKNKIKSD